jgi:hypothetical protein
MTAAIGPSGLQRCPQSINATTPYEAMRHWLAPQPK